jgi:integrase
VYRVQIPDPAAPADAPANLERTFSQTKYGGIASAHDAAKQWARTTEQAIADGTWVDPRQPVAPKPEDTTVRDVAASWRLTWDLKPLRQKTQVGYASILNRTVLPRWGDVQVGQVEARAVQAWISELAKTRDPQTLRNDYNVLRVVLRHAVRQGHISANPCTADSVELPSRKRHKNATGGSAAGVAFTVAELRQLVDALPAHWRTPVKLTAMTGLRAAELWGLTRADWDPAKGTIRVKQTLACVGAKAEDGTGDVFVVDRTKTEASDRILHVPATLHADLNAAASAKGFRHSGKRHGQPAGYVAIVEANPELAYVDDADDPRRLLFTTPNGSAPVRQGNFYRRVYRPAVVQLWPQDHRLHNARFHDLRHSVATQLLHATGNATDVMKRLGHSQLATTTDLYGRHQHEAADKALAELTGAAWAAPDELAARRRQAAKAPAAARTRQELGTLEPATAPGKQKGPVLRGLFSAPGEIRTPDLRFRRPTLYPAELRARVCFCLQIGAFSVTDGASADAVAAGRNPAIPMNMCPRTG